VKKLWISFAIVLVFSFAVLGWIGTRIYQEMPPIPASVVATDGKVVVPDGDIGRGQNVWQSMGGMEIGSILGTWQLRRPGLDCGLAASRGEFHARYLGRRRIQQALR